MEKVSGKSEGAAARPRAGSLTRRWSSVDARRGSRVTDNNNHVRLRRRGFKRGRLMWEPAVVGEESPPADGRWKRSSSAGIYCSTLRAPRSLLNKSFIAVFLLGDRISADRWGAALKISLGPHAGGRPRRPPLLMLVRCRRRQRETLAHAE